MLRLFVISMLLLIFHGALAVSPVFALELFYEGFDYPVGQLLSNQTHPNASQWLPPSAPTGASTNGSSTPHSIIAGDVNKSGALATATSSSLSLPRAFSAPSGSNTQNRINIPGRPYTRTNGANGVDLPLFFSFTMQMTSWTSFQPVGDDTKNDAGAKNAANRKGGNIAGFHGGAASTTTAMSNSPGFAAPIMIRREINYDELGTDGTPGTQTGLYEIGIFKQHGTPATTAELEASYDTSVSFGVGDVVLIVGQYDFVDSTSGGTGDIARLWINPTPGDSSFEATPSVTAPATLLNLGGTLSLESFHVKGDTITPGGFSLDNIRIGTTFADVNPAAPPLLTGDYNGNGTVDAADYVLWRNGGPLQNDPIGSPITTAQYGQWVANFGKPGAGLGSSLQAVPEPGTLVGLLVMAIIGCTARSNRRQR